MRLYGWRSVSLTITLLFLSCLCRSQTDAVPTSVSGRLIPGQRWAIVVGIGSYPHFGSLLYAKKDAEDFAGALKEKFGFPSDHVQLLDANPTAAEISKSVDAMLADPRLDRSDLIVFYFSGHGVATPHGDFLLPSEADATNVESVGLPARDLINRLSRAGLRNALFVADACRAGESNDFGRELTQIATKTNVCVMLGCQPGKRGYEYPALKGGAFTQLLLKSLEDPALIDPNSGALWASKVGQSASAAVESYTTPDHGKFAQRPWIWADQFKDVLLSLDPSKARLQTAPQSGSKLSPEEFLVQLLANVGILYSQGHIEDAFRTLDSMKGFANRDDRFACYYYLVARASGRSALADSIREEALSSPRTSYYRDLLALSPGSRGLPTDQATATLQRIWANLVWEDRVWLLTQLSRRDDLRSALRPFVASMTAEHGLNERQAKSLVALSSRIDGRLADSCRDYEAALLLPGSTPTVDELWTPLSEMAVETQGLRDQIDFLKSHPLVLNSSRNTMVAYARGLRLLGEMPGSEAALHEVVKRCKNADVLFDVLEISGNAALRWPDFASLLDGLPAEDWRVEACRSLMAASGLKNSEPPPMARIFPIDSEGAYRMSLYAPLVKRARDDLRFRPGATVQDVDAASSLTLELFQWEQRLVPHCLNDQNLWYDYIDSGQTSSLGFVAARTVASQLDFEAAKRFEQMNRVGIGVFLEDYGLDPHGLTDGASSIWSLILQERRIVREFACGKDEEARNQLNEAWAKLSETEKSSDLLAPLAEMKSLFEAKNSGSLPAFRGSVFCYEAELHPEKAPSLLVATLPNAVRLGASLYAARLIRSVDPSRLDDAGRKVYVGQTAALFSLFHGQAWVDSLTVPGSAIGDFACESSPSGNVLMSNWPESIQSSLKIGTDGALTGQVKLGPDNYAASGSVDGVGILAGKLIHGKDVLNLSAKLFPISSKTADGAFAETMCLIYLLDAKGVPAGILSLTMRRARS